MKYYEYLTEFIFVEDKPERADVIFVPGGYWGEIAVAAADLYRQGYAPLIVPSGDHSIVKDKFDGPISPQAYVGKAFDTECDFLTQVLLDEGVPREAILQERRATYTYQNAIFTRELLDRDGIRVHRAILSCQTYHAKRCLMYYQLLFPDTDILVCPAKAQGIDRDNWYMTKKGVRLVLQEVEHCGSQFREIMGLND